MTRTLYWRLLAAATAALVAAGCAQSNGDVNRVQPNVVRKADLQDGQWFFRNTVTYTPFNTQFTFPGQTGAMEKLVWEVQEKNLVGYRSYPYIVGQEPNIDDASKISGTTATYCNTKGECVGGQKYYGAPVVAFAIESHFDIQRGYNPATGEQTNVVSENSSDRPWNQREFMRVDWSANLLNTMSGMNWGTVQNPLGGASNANWIQPNEKAESPYDWPSYEYDSEGRLKYFDITGRYMANPDQVYYEDYGYIPLCYFATDIYECSSSEIKMRISISKVDPQWSRDYEPLIYDNALMSLFGYFRTERLNWDKRFGFTNDALIRLATRHRVYQRYYRTNENGDPNYDQPIPLAERQLKPIVYYFTPATRMGGTERYDEFFEPGRKVESEYDRAFKNAMAAAQQKPVEQIPQMFYLCNNPVKNGDPEACGVAGFSPKVGDLRYSFVNTVAEPVANGLLGYGPSFADPETGQLMAGMSNTYTWGVDMYGRRITDWILLLSGEKSLTDYISGADMRDYIARNPTYNLKQLNEEARTLSSTLQGIPQRNEETKGAWEKPTNRLAELFAKVRTQNGLPRATRDEMKVAAEKLAAVPDVEAAVLDNPDMQADLLNLLPPFAQARAKQDPQFLRKAARGVLTNVKVKLAWEKARKEWFSKNNVYMSEFDDRTLVGVALEKLGYRGQRVTELKANGDPRCENVSACSDADAKRIADDEIARQIRQNVWYSTTLHELGHTFNLRHNFQGTFDAINYFPHYWDLKEPTITVDQNGTKKIPRTPADIKLALDGTEAQQLDGIHGYQYSSIMDYHGKEYGNWQGIGRYDEAAIMFAYSGDKDPGYVEVFDGARSDSKQFQGSDGANMTISGAAVDLPIVNATHRGPTTPNYTERFHYSLVPLHFGEGTTIGDVIRDGIIKMNKRHLVKYSEVKADEERVRAILEGDPSLVNDPDRAKGLIGSPLLRVPYMFCSDESADGPVLSCNRFDTGADYYEMVRQQLEDYWNYYFDTHYRRDKRSFNGNSAFNNTFNTFYMVANGYKHWVLSFYAQSQNNQEQLTRFKLDPVLQDSWTMAVLDGVNNHLNVFSVPPFGLFMYRNLASGARWDVVSEGDDFDMLNTAGREKLQNFYTDYYGAEDFVVLQRGLGRRMYSRYDFKSGFGFWDRMLEAGHYNDQIAAMFAAVLPQIDVQGTDIIADQNRYNIPYYLVFRDELSAHFSALWSNNEDTVRPTLYKEVNNAGQLTGTSNLYWKRHILGENLFNGFVYPKPAPQACTGNQTPPDCFRPDQRAAPANIQMTWTSRIYSLYLGEALFSVNYDLDYAKSNQVYKLGGNEQFTVAAGYHTVEVPDIITGSRYLAVERDGAAADTTPAVRMIGLANVYLQMVQDPTRCPLPDYLTILGYSCMDAAQANNPALVAERRRYWTEVFQDQLRDLDLMRGMYSIFGKAF